MVVVAYFVDTGTKTLSGASGVRHVPWHVTCTGQWMAKARMAEARTHIQPLPRHGDFTMAFGTRVETPSHDEGDTTEAEEAPFSAVTYHARRRLITSRLFTAAHRTLTGHALRSRPRVQVAPTAYKKVPPHPVTAPPHMRISTSRLPLAKRIEIIQRYERVTQGFMHQQRACAIIVFTHAKHALTRHANTTRSMLEDWATLQSKKCDSMEAMKNIVAFYQSEASRSPADPIDALFTLSQRQKGEEHQQADQLHGGEALYKAVLLRTLHFMVGFLKEQVAKTCPMPSHRALMHSSQMYIGPPLQHAQLVHAYNHYKATYDDLVNELRSALPEEPQEASDAIAHSTTSLSASVHDITITPL